MNQATIEIPAPSSPVDRASYIGSADIAAIFGVEGSFSSPYEVWARKRRILPPKEVTRPMEVGLVMEPTVLRWYSQDELSAVSLSQVFFRHSDWDFLGCTVDGLVFDGGKPVRIVEAKTSRDYRWDAVPLQYEAQVQWQMGISGIHQCDLAVLHRKDLDLAVYRIDFNKATFDALEDHAIDFWKGFVETGKPPEVDATEATTEALKTIACNPGTQVAIDQLAERLLALESLKLSIKDQEAQKELIENEIRLAMGENEIGMINGIQALSLKTTRGRTTIDSKLLESQFPEAYAACKKTGSDFRTIRISKKKD